MQYTPHADGDVIILRSRRVEQEYILETERPRISEFSAGLRRGKSMRSEGTVVERDFSWSDATSPHLPARKVCRAFTTHAFEASTDCTNTVSRFLRFGRTLQPSKTAFKIPARTILAVPFSSSPTRAQHSLHLSLTSSSEQRTWV
jgi:hypothetical protein